MLQFHWNCYGFVSFGDCVIRIHFTEVIFIW